ncbi:MAG: hypothetical protein ACOCWM_00155 [Cyclobacteriaceae bacterium]
MNSTKHNPVIVVVAYNRLNSIKRLLGSLKKGNYPYNTKLVISIDYAPGNSPVVEYAREYEWEAGDKKVIVHPSNIGLRNHIISCGDFSLEYGSVIILEDDLYVSPHFYSYAQQVMEFYSAEPNIGGIALFNYQHIENTQHPEPFRPLADDSDVYFLQYACSSGQIWTADQWKAFRKWYDTNPDIKTVRGMPEHVLMWPERSWKKFFIAFLIETNRYFVYPRYSLTTNFDDVGTNRGMSTFEVQSVLLIAERRFSFKSFRDSESVYDAHFEMQPETLKHYNGKLKDYNFSVDLYGHKNIDRINEDFILTTKKCTSPVYSFARSLKPHEMNIMFDIQGEDIFLCNKKYIDRLVKREKVRKFVSDFNYYYRNILEMNEIMLFVRYKIYNIGVKIKGFFGFNSQRGS